MKLQFNKTSFSFLFFTSFIFLHAQIEQLMSNGGIAIIQFNETLWSRQPPDNLNKGAHSYFNKIRTLKENGRGSTVGTLFTKD